MLAHETLPTEIQNIIKFEDLSISYLYLFNIQGFLYKKNIGVNTNLTLYKARFIISHEIGHYMHGDCQNLIGVPFWKNLNEKKADNFALEILLPEDELLEAGETYEWDLSILEKVFGVEKELIEKRIKILFINTANYENI